jgi:hypothetical protein
MARLAILPVQPKGLVHGGSNAGIRLAQHVSLIVKIRHEAATFDPDLGFQVQPVDNSRDVQIVFL